MPRLLVALAALVVVAIVVAHAVARARTRKLLERIRVRTHDTMPVQQSTESTQAHRTIQYASQLSYV